jgi:transcription initiation factor IIE alpha subunit
LRRNPNGDFERAAYHMAFDNVPTITDKEKHIILNKLEFADQEIRKSFEKQKLNSL